MFHPERRSRLPCRRSFRSRFRAVVMVAAGRPYGSRSRMHGPFDAMNIVHGVPEGATGQRVGFMSGTDCSAPLEGGLSDFRAGLRPTPSDPPTTKAAVPHCGASSRRCISLADRARYVLPGPASLGGSLGRAARSCAIRRDRSNASRSAARAGANTGSTTRSQRFRAAR